MKTAFDIFANRTKKPAAKKPARARSTDAHLKLLSPEVRAIALAARKLRGAFGPV